MQLFHLAKEQLKYIGALVQRLDEDESGIKVFPECDIPLLHFDLGGMPKGLKPGESRQFDGINLLVSAPLHGELDRDGIEQGINDFVSLALLFAFARAAFSAEGHEGGEESVKLMDDREAEKVRYLRFAHLDTEAFGLSAAGTALDRLEKLMFKGWKEVKGDGEFMRKPFSGEADCLQAEHLLEALGRAAGYTHEEIETQFAHSPNERTLTVSRDFLEVMARVEQTLEADFGKQLH